jgi:hypothetical protein
MAARDALNKAQREHMRALQSAFAAGIPACVIQHEAEQFNAGVWRLIVMCTRPRGDAPMVLA